MLPLLLAEPGVAIPPSGPIHRRSTTKQIWAPPNITPLSGDLDGQRITIRLFSVHGSKPRFGTGLGNKWSPPLENPSCSGPIAESPDRRLPRTKKE